MFFDPFTNDLVLLSRPENTPSECLQEATNFVNENQLPHFGPIFTRKACDVLGIVGENDGLDGIGWGEEPWHTV